MRKMTICSVVVCMVAFSTIVSADTIRGINMDFVTIGNAGNAADTTGYGAVGYDYRIGKYEITNAQWNTFTFASGAPTGNDGGYGSTAIFTSVQQPTNGVSWYEALQFCNYLTSGDKSKGVYQFSGNNANPGNFLGIDRFSANLMYKQIYFLPTENEWYKAAYHKNDGVTGNYWLYPTQSNDIPSNDLINPDPGNNGNFYQNGYTIDYPGGLTAIGGFENSDSAYGTFDQSGNVWEWNEVPIGYTHNLRGGSFGDFDGVNYVYAFASSYQYYFSPDGELQNIGFRIATIIPEPCSLVLLGLGGLLLRRRKK